MPARGLLIASIAIAAALSPALRADGADFADMEAEAIGRCRNVNPRAFETFMIFNPAGMQTYYRRSYCLQTVAIEHRNEALCGEVTERRDFFLDGSQISEAACREKVAAAQAADRTEAGNWRRRTSSA